jgi:hypothetical protein
VWLVLPGLPDGRGGAFTGGEKLLPPVGLMLFSVGVGDGATDDVVVVVEVLEGAGDSVPLHPAVKAPMAIIALPPATSAKRRAHNPNGCAGGGGEKAANVNIVAYFGKLRG